MTNPGVIQQQDHRSINDAIDEAFVEAVMCRSEYIVQKQFKKGNPVDISSRFYYWFGILLTLTANHKSMREREATLRAKQIIESEKPDVASISHAIAIFDDYRFMLESAGIVTITK